MRSQSFLDDRNTGLAHSAVRDHGCFLVENAVSPEFCEQVIRLIDGYKTDKKTEVHYAGTELRIWDAQDTGPDLGRFYETCHETVARISGKSVRPKTLLAIRNLAIDPGARDLQTGRWHLDSFFSQYKIFLFLTDTTEQSGPFEFIPGTQSPWFKLRMLSQGICFRPSNLVDRQRAYQKIDDRYVERLTRKGRKPQPLLCKAGTVAIADTSLIHRARPCFGGSRYALTAYYA